MELQRSAGYLYRAGICKWKNPVSCRRHISTYISNKIVTRIPGAMLLCGNKQEIYRSVPDHLLFDVIGDLAEGVLLIA